MRQFFHAVVVHGGNEVVDVAFQPILEVAFFLVRNHVVLVENRNVVVGFLAVGADADDGFGVVGHLKTGALGGVDGGGDVLEDGLQAAFNDIHIHIADDDDAL